MKKNKNAVLILLNYGIVVALLLMIAIFSFTSKNFFRTSTMFTILKQVSITGIVCIGQTMVMLTGGIDLSVGSVAGVSAVTGGSGNNIGIGAAVGAIVGLVADTMVKDIYYTMVADVEIRQRPALDEKISQNEENYSEQGTTSTISQNVNTNNVQWKIYRTRVVSTANQVNLEFEEAQAELSKGLVRSLSGLL